MAYSICRVIGKVMSLPAFAFGMVKVRAFRSISCLRMRAPSPGRTPVNKQNRKYPRCTGLSMSFHAVRHFSKSFGARAT